MKEFTPYFWILFGIFSLVHIYFCFKENEKARKISKCFIMPLLIVYMIMIESDKVFVYIAAILGFLGDFLIIFKKNRKFFVAGALSFMFGHVFYMIEMYRLMGGFNYWHIFVYLIIGFVLFILGYNLVWPKFGKTTIFGITYFTFLVSCLFVAVSTRVPLIVLGTFAFVVSDSILAFVNFFKTDIRRKEMYVMFTYILAQTLMILALA